MKWDEAVDGAAAPQDWGAAAPRCRHAASSELEDERSSAPRHSVLRLTDPVSLLEGVSRLLKIIDGGAAMSHRDAITPAGQARPPANLLFSCPRRVGISVAQKTQTIARERPPRTNRRS